MSTAIRFFLIVLLLVIGVGTLSAQDIAPLSLTDVLQTRVPQVMETHHIPGLSMVLIRDGQIVWKKAFGVRVAGKPEPVDTETIFEAASMSKPLFCYAVLKLVEEGKFDLARPLDSYLEKPYLPDEAAANKITGRMVMTHRTGLPNWRRGGAPLHLKNEPDFRFTYSGEGILYLQRAVECVTGEALKGWMQTRLLEPIGMDRSSYRWEDRFEANFAGGHDKNGKANKGRRFYKEPNAAYSLYTTPTDYARFLIEIMKPDRSAAHSLNAKSIEKMTTLQVNPEYGKPRSRRSLGWIVESAADGGHVTHTGTNGAGFHCVSRFHMGRRSGCVIMTNNVGAREALETILKIIDEPMSANEKCTDQQTAGSAEQYRCWEPVARTVRYEYRVMNPTDEPVTKIDVNVPLPFESPRQEIRYLHLPKNPNRRIITDRHGQRIAHYVLDRLEPGEWVDLGYVVGITLKNIQWNSPDASTKEAATLTPEQRELYLRPETNYSMESELMRETAASLTKGTASEFEKLVRIHDHVIGAIRYVRDDRWDPAETILARGTGSCSEYNYVLSGLCRLAGLPTRCAGGTIGSFREFPTTDTVFHRWTEVFLSGYGWFPVDCSRGGNPVRGNRSFFGRVYTDAVVWCRQAGGEDDTLGWDYRGHARVEGKQSRIREDHRVRWFEFYPEERVKAAEAWFRNGKGEVPGPDLLECTLLCWPEADEDARLRIVEALAESGRADALRWAAFLPATEESREAALRKLCMEPDLAEKILKESNDLWKFRNWFKKRESRFRAADGGRFELRKSKADEQTPKTTARYSEIWPELAEEAADRLVKKVEKSGLKSLVIAPIVDQTAIGLGKDSGSFLSTIRERIAQQPDVRLLDYTRFDEWMKTQGPGSRQYWLFAVGDYNPPEEVSPQAIVVPVCVTDWDDESVVYRFDLKMLEVDGCRYTTLSNKRRRVAERTADGQGVLVAGGDTVLARWEHDLVARHGYDWPLEGVAGILASADAALCNLECCVSLRGEPIDKGERCSFYYRARPEMLRCLTRAGIDVVTAANNHGGDYGPQAVEDTAKWCEEAGLICTGIGKNAEHAQTPRIVEVGPVRVGVAGIDATKRHSAAGKNRPGTNFVPEDESLEAFTEQVKQLGAWADGRCDLLALTIHWGPNWADVPSAARKKMARIAFENGVDLILGHSAHRLQGIEIVDGKPVLYDMGNLLFDCKLSDEGRRSALFRLFLSPKGVERIEIVPAEALCGQTVLPDAEGARSILAEMTELCNDLGTAVSIGEDLEGKPMGVIEIAEPKATPRKRPAVETASEEEAKPEDKQKPKEIEIPDSVDPSLLADKIPEDAHDISPPATPAPGVELLAHRLPETAPQDGIMTLTTWWRVKEKVGKHCLLAFHVQPESGETPRRGTPWYTRHDARDWTIPLHRLEPGMIVEDRYPCRLAGLPAGRYKVYAVILDTSLPPDNRVQGEPCLLGEVVIEPRKAK